MLLVGLFAISLLACEKEEKSNLLETGTMVDQDNNVYSTVKIGNQWWMAENLRVTHYRNGAVIQNISSSDSLQWSTTSSGAYCQYDDNTSAPGLLYNYFALVDSNLLAPPGWHIPTDAEWKELERAIGMSEAETEKLAWRGSNEADKLKVSGVEAWSEYNSIWSTNESGFAAKAGGCRLFNSEWSNPSGISYAGFWWSKSSFNSNEAYYRYLDYKSSKVFRSHVDQHYGFSVRCIKD